jgi:thiol:disulfide interchange protein/DsbC/DsbD-like thiol-disulfide interchange protein
MRFILLFMSFLYAPQLWADEAPRARATLVADTASIQANVPFTIGFQLEIAEGWHVYWQNPGDSGAPTKITWEDVPENIRISDMAWPTPARLPYGTLLNYGYSNRVVFPITITASTDLPSLTLNARAEWLVCADICIPESARLSLTLPHQDAEARITLDDAIDLLPKAVASGHYRADEHTVTIAMPLGDSIDVQAARIAHATWFPIDDGIIRNAAPQQFSVTENMLHITAPRGAAATQTPYRGVMTLRDGNNDLLGAYQLSLALETASANASSPAPPTSEPQSLPSEAHRDTASSRTTNNPGSVIEALLLAFLGGLLLNLMPCVLPVLSLKALSLAKKSTASRMASLAQGISYSAGVVASFLAIAAILIALTQAGHAVGWGFQLQSPHVVSGLALLMVAVSLNLFGLFEWPSLVRNITGPKNDSSYSGSFFTGVLAVAVATPCTAPFMAPALGYAALQPPEVALTVFAALGLGLAAPFLLMSAFPVARHILPKPGQWMVTFKQALAFPMLATAMWLLWVQLQLNYASGLAVSFSGLLLLSLCLWLRAKLARRGSIWLVAALLVCVGTVLLQPPAQPISSPASHENIRQVAYSPEALQALRAEGVPVFVDATAAWCITCKINEHTSLRDRDVEAAFVEYGVTLMVADWTAKDATITRYLAQYGRNGVPLYVYYAPGEEGVVLPQILTPSMVIRAITSQ